MTMKASIGLAAGIAGLAFATPAEAVILNYTLTGDYTATWQLDSQPVPDPADVSLGEGVILRDVIGAFPGGLPPDLVELCFFNEAIGGGLLIRNDTTGLILASIGDDVGIGRQVYSGPEDSPTMLTGEFDFIGVVDDTGELLPDLHYHLSVTAVPEPATWMTMILGFGMVGAGLRRSRARMRVRVRYG